MKKSSLRIRMFGILALSIFPLQTAVGFGSLVASAATCMWDGTDGDWSDVTKWSCGVVPDSDDDVTIGAGMVTLNAATTVLDFNMNGGTLTGSGTLTVSEEFNWMSGTIALDDGGQGADLTADSTATFNSGSTKTLGSDTRILLNEATTWSSGHIMGNDGSVITNTDTLAQNTNFTLLVNGSPSTLPLLDNQGMYVFNGPAQASIDWRFENFGTVQVQSHTFDLAGGGMAFSEFRAVSTGTLLFSAGDFDVSLADFATSGSGVIDFSDPTMDDTLNGTISSSSEIDVSEGTVTFTQVNIGGLFEISGGTAGFNQNTSLGGLNWLTGTVRTTPGAIVSVDGSATLSSGSGKTVAARSTLQFNGLTVWSSGHITGNDSSMVVNTDSMAQNTNFTYLVNGNPPTRPRFDNQGGYSFTGPAQVNVAWRFDNNGILNVIDDQFNLTGGGTAGSTFMASSTGVLRFQGGAFDLGAADFVTTGNGLIDFSAPSIDDTLNGTISNASAIEVSDGDVTFTQSNIGGTFEVSGGIAAFNQNTSLADLDWTGGTIQTAAGMTLSVDGPTSVSTGTGKEVAANSNVQLNGATTWSSGHITGNDGAVIANTGTMSQNTNFTLLVSGSPSTLPLLDNQATYIFNSPAIANIEWQFDNSGSVEVQSFTMGLNGGGTNSGLMQILAGAGLSINSAGFTNQNAGSIGGLGIVALSGGGANYTNSGTYAPGVSPGVLGFNGDYENSTLEIEIDDGTGPGAGHDLLSVDGDVALSDTVNVILDSGFTPSVGQQFAVISCSGTCSGGFDSISDNSSNVQFDQLVTADTVFLTVAASLPVELASFDAIAEGLDVALTWSTQTETNNAGFEIQRMSVPQESAPNAVASWEQIGWIEGAGTTTEPREYAYRIEALDPGLYTFRLKQVDFDGTFEFSPTVEAETEVPGTHLLIGSYPNPFDRVTQIRLAVAVEQRVLVDAFDATGRRIGVFFDEELPDNRTETIRIDGSRWGSGAYLLRIRGETFSEILRVIHLNL